MKLFIKEDLSNVHLLNERIETMNIQRLWDEFENGLINGYNYAELSEWQKRLEPFGIGFKYSLDSEPFDFHIIS